MISADTKFEPREWQIKAIGKVRTVALDGADRALVYACPGSGKTYAGLLIAQALAVVQKQTLLEPKSAAPATKASIDAKINMMMLLADAYDHGGQDYKSGWSDARIAKETGLSEAFVGQRRAADFGPIAPPRKAIMREAAGMCSKLLVCARDLGDVALAINRKAESLKAEAERLSALLGAEAEKGDA